MPTSKAQQRATNKYKKNNYDRIELNVPKGQREEIRLYAKSVGIATVNDFIKRSIQAAMKYGLPEEFLHGDDDEFPVDAEEENPAGS